MRIERLELQNCMRFETFEANFAPGFNVIIGENGTGKTTLLTILARLMSHWSSTPIRLVVGRDVRESVDIVNGMAVAIPHRPWMIEADWIAPDGQPHRSRHGIRSGSHTTGLFSAMLRKARYGDWPESAESNLDQRLPLLAYFSPWRDQRDRSGRAPKIDVTRPARRLSGYTGAFDLHASFKDFARWFKTGELASIQSGHSLPALEAAREAVRSCLPDCTDVRYWVGIDEVMIERSNGERHPVWRLSDGYRSVLALVGELAWRASVLNPGFGSEATSEVDGIVLIDEIDLHLHPTWQRRVVTDLRRAFPRVQFIATTHSPFVVQSMQSNEVINLDRSSSLDYQRSSLEDIAEVEMGVEGVQRSRVFQEKVAAAREYLRALEQRPEDAAGLAALKSRLDDLQARFGADPVYVASLLQKRAAKGLE